MNDPVEFTSRQAFDIMREHEYGISFSQLAQKYRCSILDIIEAVMQAREENERDEDDNEHHWLDDDWASW